MGMPLGFHLIFKFGNKMKYFTLHELTASPTAKRRGINNNPDGAVRANLTALVSNILDPLREMWGAPIIVTSGYRCGALNRAVGGASKSQHVTGCAADIRTVSDTLTDNKKLFDTLIKSGLPFDQLIWEYGDDRGPDWIHVSYVPGGRREVLRASTGKDGKTIYTHIK